MAVRVVAAWVEREGRVLLAQRPPGKHLAGTWEFPGGKCEPEESDADALVRELAEELGVRVTNVEANPLAEVEHAYPSIAIHLVLYRVEIEGEPRAIEAAVVGWFDRDRIRDVELSPADIELVIRQRSGT
jgi:8-oxo-dGTP diphosphatase